MVTHLGFKPQQASSRPSRDQMAGPTLERGPQRTPRCPPLPISQLLPFYSTPLTATSAHFSPGPSACLRVENKLETT